MPKKDIKQLFENKQNSMLALFGELGNVSHSGAKGDATEDEWIKWFSAYFPKRYKAEKKGFVIDCEGNLSDEIDIIIYDEYHSPIIFQVGTVKYIAAESVFAVFEVKQTLTKEHIEYASKKIESVRKLKRTSADINTLWGSNKGKKPQQIIGGLLTYKTDWVDKKIIENIQTNIKVLEPENQIDFICCFRSLACHIEYGEVPISMGKKIYDFRKLTIKTNNKNGVLIYTYFKLLRLLQGAGNVPAIDFTQYGIED